MCVRVCDNCFKVGHFASGCLQKSGCYIEDCNRKHVTIIHPQELSLPAKQETPETYEMNNNDNNEANLSNQSHARENAEHTSQNNAKEGRVRKPGVNQVVGNYV